MRGGSPWKNSIVRSVGFVGRHDRYMDTLGLQSQQVAQGERFEFGKNWSGFLSVLNDDRISQARLSLQEMLQTESLTNLSFLDVGSGSGLFSLAAAQLGARIVHSCDFDPDSVGCAQELRRRYAAHIDRWTIEHGSVLDRRYVESLGEWDVVYSWGVLHHTGDMLTAMDNVALPVAPGGHLFIAIYNDQGRASRRWRQIKRTYNALPPALRAPFVAATMAPFELRSALGATAQLNPQAYLRKWTEYKRSRGMSRWHDLVDWCGGYPYEPATPDVVVDFFGQRGFALTKIKTRLGGWGCNEFVFTNGT